MRGNYQEIGHKYIFIQSEEYTHTHTQSPEIKQYSFSNHFLVCIFFFIYNMKLVTKY